jgi:hypothetical protein
MFHYVCLWFVVMVFCISTTAKISHHESIHQKQSGEKCLAAGGAEIGFQGEVFDGRRDVGLSPSEISGTRKRTGTVGIVPRADPRPYDKRSPPTN